MMRRRRRRSSISYKVRRWASALSPSTPLHDAALMLTEFQILETSTDLTFNVFCMTTAYSQARIRSFTDAFCPLADTMIDIKNP